MAFSLKPTDEYVNPLKIGPENIVAFVVKGLIIFLKLLATVLFRKHS